MHKKWVANTTVVITKHKMTVEVNESTDTVPLKVHVSLLLLLLPPRLNALLQRQQLLQHNTHSENYTGLLIEITEIK